MTLAALPSHHAHDHVSAAPDWQLRSEIRLAEQQLQAVEHFNRARRLQEHEAAAATASRELRMDAARSMDVLRRQHDAVVARADEQLRATGELLHSIAVRRVVLAHRNDWLVRKLVLVLEEQDVRVVARTDNGADAVGLTIAEQPDLVLVEDTLAMMAGLEVVQEVRRFSPDTVVTAHAAYGDRVGQLLDAGATRVFTRRTPPHDVAQGMLQLVGAA